MKIVFFFLTRISQLQFSFAFIWQKQNTLGTRNALRVTDVESGNTLWAPNMEPGNSLWAPNVETDNAFWVLHWHGEMTKLAIF